MGPRLRKLKDEYRGGKLCDKKPLSGKGLLTDVVIDQLTTYYGNTIRKYPDSDSVRGMQRAIWAIWYHKSSNGGEVTHGMCPSGKDSSCAYQKAYIEYRVFLTSAHSHYKTILPRTLKLC
jgi:hypothetical protein